MKRFFKNALSIVLALTIVFSSAIVGFGEVAFGMLFAVKAGATTIGGTVGDNVYWSIDDEGTLTIRGNAHMANYSGSSPFKYLSVKNVVIEEGVMSIGDYIFMDCTNLTSITIPDSVTSIGTKTFSGCTNLTSITIPSSVRGIGEWAFESCKSLTSVIIPDSVTSIGDYAFYCCTNLTSATISSEVIGYRAFVSCDSLTSLTIGNNVANIKIDAFASCENINYVFYTDAKEKWENISVGNGNIYLTSAAIHYESVDHTYGNYFFDYSTSTKIQKCTVCDYALSEKFLLEDLLTFTLNDDGISYSITDCKESVTGEVVIPETYNGLPVTCVGSYAFSNCKNITSITIHSTISSINGYAFYNCDKLRDFKINDLAAWCLIDFGECIINHFPWNLYLNDVLVTELIIPESITEIKDYAFDGCGNIVSVTIPEGVVRIGDSAFSNNHSLNEVSLPKGIIDIGMSAFSATGISNNMQIRENGALYIDEYLIEVFEPSSENYIIKDGTVLIAGGAFAWTFTEDIQIKSIEIPSSVKYICDNAFSHCSSLCEITIPSGVKTIGNAVFYNCTNLISIVIPDSIITIGDYAFYCCPNLKYLFYSGSKECWNNIIKGSMNYIFDDVYIHYNTTSHEPSNWIIDINPSCVDYGVKHIECSQCGLFMKEEIIPETGTHKPTDWIIDKNATCTQAGSKHKECTVCGETTETETFPATGHIVVKDNAVAATCTTAGKTEGSHCSVCNTVIKAQTTVSAKGHTASALKYNEETRTEYKECTVCKAVLESKYNPLNTTKITSCYNEVNGVQLKWTAVDDAVEYDVYRKLPSQNEWMLITTTTELSYQDTDVVGNTVYQYRVKAVDQYNNESVFSAQRECRFIETPTLLTRENAVGGVKITWEKVAGATSYRIYRRGAGTDYWYYLGDYSADLNTFIDKELSIVKSGNYYRYTVRASYDGKDSREKDYLIYSGFDTNGLYLKYVATPKLTSISNATNGLQIKWNAVNGGGDTEYRVYRRGAGSTYWKYLGTTTGTVWTDAGVKNSSGNYYRYTVRAVAGKNGSGWYSAFDTNGLFLMRLANPTLKSAVSSSSGITVKWSSVKGATSYYVYRKTASTGWTRIAVVSGNTNVSYLDKTAKKGTTYVYTVRAVYGSTTSYFNSGISCKDKY